MKKVVEMYYTVQELSCLLRFSERWVRDAVKAGQFGAYWTIKGQVRVPASAVNAFIEANTVEPAGTPRSVRDLVASIQEKVAA